MQLPPVIAYYIRKLLRQNLDRLQFVAAIGAAMKADQFSDLNVVIASLYLEDAKINSVILDLERLALSHQAIGSQGAIHRQELQDLEQRMFWLLGFKQLETKHQGTVLIVDDTPENLRLLSSALNQQGYDIRSAISGSMVLSGIQSILPDLILLDVMMPGMNGYELCERLKANSSTCDIPVIFISAIDDPLDKVKAFKTGAVDYITKPFQIEEVIARVEHQLHIRDLQRRLEDQNMRLQQEIQERERILQVSEDSLKAREQAEEQRRSLEEKLQQSDQQADLFLLNSLPQSIAARFKQGQVPIADLFAEATVLFADIVDFSSYLAQASPTQLVDALNQIFSTFDHLTAQFGLERVKTIGATYMAVGGVPTPCTDHAEAIADLALAMQQAIEQFRAITPFQEYPNKPLSLRIGIHTGSVIAGVVAAQKISYDLWGETINLASRMESEGVAGKIQVTTATYRMLKNKYRLEARGTINIEGKGQITTYWLVEKKAQIEA
jgi:adenylate cyclase